MAGLSAQRAFVFAGLKARTTMSMADKLSPRKCPRYATDIGYGKASQFVPICEGFRL